MPFGNHELPPVTRTEAKKANRVIRDAGQQISQMLNGVYVRTDMEDLLITIQDAVEIVREYNKL